MLNLYNIIRYVMDSVHNVFSQQLLYSLIFRKHVLLIGKKETPVSSFNGNLDVIDSYYLSFSLQRSK